MNKITGFFMVFIKAFKAAWKETGGREKEYKRLLVPGEITWGDFKHYKDTSGEA